MTDEVQDIAGAPDDSSERKSGQTTSKSQQAGMTEGQIREFARREAQSLVAQEVNKAFGGLQRWRKGVEEKAHAFDDVVGRLSKAGKIPEGTDLSDVRQALVGEALTQFPSDEAEGETEAQPVDKGETTEAVERSPQTDPVWFTANLVAEEYGLLEDDPEVDELVTDQGPVKYIESVVAAAHSKRQRLAASGEGKEADLDTLVPTDMGTGKSSRKNPLEDVNNPDDLLEMGLYGKS